MISEPTCEATTPSATPLVEARNITKRFPGTLALSSVDLCVYPGEIVAVIGENGAGKSTLMKILAGVLPVDHGDIVVEGRNVLLTSVRQATALGIVLIHQELSLLSNLTVAANIFLGREPQYGGWIKSRKLYLESKKILQHVGLEIDPDRTVSLLSIGQRQLVEVARALSTDVRLLIMDEPTSSLSEKEADTLFGVIHEMKDRGVSVLYVSHRLGEVEAIADRVVVLRDGVITGRIAGTDIQRDTMVRCMVGRDIAGVFERKAQSPGPPALQVEQLVCGAKHSSPISFTLCKGEIVGLAGLVGSGRSTLLRTLFGIDTPHSGRVVVGNKPVSLGSPRRAIAAGMGLVPEDRGLQGLILAMSTQPNLSLGVLHRHCIPGGLLNRQWERESSKAMITQLSIRGVHGDKATRHLSGGNQQKVVLGKWLLLSPQVLLLDEPTRGIDIGAKQEIYHVIEDLASQGMAILFASSEMEEVLVLSNRVLVMHERRIVGELEHAELSEETIMRLATGHTSAHTGRA